MNLYKYLLFIGLLSFAHTSVAQRLRGSVRDADTGAPLAGVSISLGTTPDIDELALTTDDTGEFFTDVLRPGYYECFFSLEGYEPLLVREVRIVSGKEKVLDVAMRQSSTPLPDVTIKAAAPDRRALQPLGEIPLTREQTDRFPATFFDPARLALAYPGVANTDDQANGLTIRGNGPASVRWRLEGIDVVNPNHLPNAGTFGDRPTTSSGGVLLFSAQLLDNSSLLTGAFPAGYGDALGGIMDMAWRRGNRDDAEFTIQAGIIGIDLAAEGPLDKKHRHSYLANYRYSTFGLLGQMGISFGGEKISFQDFSFKMDFAGKKGGQWAVFGAGGLSENIFTPPADSADVAVYKDLFNIEFKSRTAIAGVSHWAPLGRNAWWKISAVYSGQSNERLATGAGIRETDESEESRMGFSATIFRKINDQNRLQAGLNAQNISFTGSASRNSTALFDGDLPAMLLQPWASWEWSDRRQQTSLRLGLHTVILRIRGEQPARDAGAEPRLLLTRRFGKKSSLSLGWGLYSQISPLWIYADRAPQSSVRYPNREIGLTRSQQASLRYSRQTGGNWLLKSEVFYQRLYDVPVFAESSDAFSILNINEIQSLQRLSATGSGENKGIELSAERYLDRGWFLVANATLFDARYRGSDGVWRSSRWNLRHIANVTAGKEWQRDSWPDKMRAFGVNGRVTWAGGQRAAPVDAVASAAAQATVYDFSNGYSIQQQDFIRLDLRVYWRRNIGERRNSTFAMDFQNVAIQKNVAYQYYDPYTGKVETKEQLGLVPNLSWRLEF